MKRVQKVDFKKWVKGLPNDNIIKTVYLILAADVNRQTAKNESGITVLIGRKAGQFGH